MQLVFISHGSGAALQITHITVVIGNDKGAFKLPRVAGIDAEIRTQFHGASHPLGDIYKGAIAEHGTVKCGIEVVTIGHYRAQILFHQMRILLDGIADRAKQYTHLCQFFLEGGFHRHRVHDSIYRHPAQRQSLFQRDAQFVERLHQLGIYLFLVAALFACHRVGIVRNGLVIHLGQMHMPPLGLFQGAPIPISLQAEVEHPLRLTLLA